jgi:hypothetical protein
MSSPSMSAVAVQTLSATHAERTAILNGFFSLLGSGA